MESLRPGSGQRSPATSSFPSPLPPQPGSRSQQAPSIVSSRMTDIASEDGDEFHSGGIPTGGRPGTAASTDPNRPGSAMSAQTRPSTRPPQSRRGIGSPSSLASWRTGGAFGGHGESIANSSRPPSSTSRASRTHVPSLASHAFFRPMSSQRLQAQRSARPARFDHGPTSLDGSSDTGSITNRRSLVSNLTNPRGTSNLQDHEKPPPSMETAFTEQDDRGTVNASPTDNATVQSIGESERPLQDQALNARFTHNNFDRENNGSPKSFRANFHRPANTRMDTQGHERLSSSNDSPTFIKHTQSLPSKPGVNYQYFSGNTVFIWKGRFQNTRDRPINIATVVIVLLPCILFLVFS